MSTAQIIYNAIRTPDGTVLVSHTRHDFKEYTDKNGKTYCVDGGKDYLRRSTHYDQEDLTVFLSDDHEVNRKWLHWGSMGVNALGPMRWRSVEELTTDHIISILENCWYIYGSYVEDVLNKELSYRDEQGIE